MNISTYAEKINIPVEDLVGTSRKSNYVIARFVYWYALNKGGMPASHIGKLFNRDGSTVLHGIRQMVNYIEVSDSIISPYKEFLEMGVE